MKTKIIRGYLIWKGKKYHVEELSEKYNINTQTIRWRLRNGWSVEKALTTPIGYNHANSLKKKAKKSGVNHTTVWSRISRGIPENIALSSPAGTLPRKKPVRTKPVEEKESYLNIWQFKLWAARVDQAILSTQMKRITRAIRG